MQPSKVAGFAATEVSSPAINYDGWAGLGALYVLRGNQTNAAMEVELHDIASRVRILGKSYPSSGADQRRLALRITDDVMQAMTARPGIFSSRIGFLTGSRIKEISVIEPDGGGRRQLTQEGSLVATPAFGKSGTEIYFTSYRDNNPDLYGITLDGRRWNISRRPGQNIAAAWSEPAGRIAASLSKDGNPEIYTMTREGRGLSRLTNHPGADTSPAWSPDGRQIAFTSDRDGVPGIFIMAASGGAPRRVSPGGRYADSPCWSPDGQRLAFSVRESGAFNIHVVELATGASNIVARGAMNTSPSWGASSRHLVFSSNRAGARQLFLVNIDTRQPRPIPNTQGGHEPTWSPLVN
jgi:TolB protein